MTVKQFSCLRVGEFVKDRFHGISKVIRREMVKEGNFPSTNTVRIVFESERGEFHLTAFCNANYISGMKYLSPIERRRVDGGTAEQMSIFYESSSRSRAE